VEAKFESHDCKNDESQPRHDDVADKFNKWRIRLSGEMCSPQMTEEVKQTFCVIRRLDGRYLKDMKKGTRTDNILDAVRFLSEELQKLKATVPRCTSESYESFTIEGRGFLYPDGRCDFFSQPNWP